MPNDLLSGMHDGKNDFMAGKDNNYSKEEEFQNNMKPQENREKTEKSNKTSNEAGFERKKKEKGKVDFVKKANKMQNLDLENINLNSATYMVLDQIDSHLTEMKEEIEMIKSNLSIQDTQIVEKVKNALRQELSTIA